MQTSPHSETAQPNGLPSSSSLDVRAITRQGVMEAASRDGEHNSVWISANSMCISINGRYLGTQHPGEHFEVDLHDLWHRYYHASMNIPSESPCQDRLVVQILQQHEEGLLTRQDPTSTITETASTSDGMIWSDLPFLVPDMTDFWITNCASMSGPQRLGFSGFLGRLASVDVANNRLCGIALIVLRDTLETVRPLGQLGDSENEEPGRTIEDLSVSALLPSANCWLFHARIKIVHLSERSWNDCPPQVGDLGSLVCLDTLNGVTAGGFTPQRWLYWLKRLHELAVDASLADKVEDNLAKFISRVMDNMLLTVENMNTSLRAEAEAVRAMTGHQIHVVDLGQEQD